MTRWLNEPIIASRLIPRQRLPLRRLQCTLPDSRLNLSWTFKLKLFKPPKTRERKDLSKEAVQEVRPPRRGRLSPGTIRTAPRTKNRLFKVRTPDKHDSSPMNGVHRVRRIDEFDESMRSSESPIRTSEYWMKISLTLFEQRHAELYLHSPSRDHIRESR